MKRSLTKSPRFSKLPPRECGRVIARTGISLNTRRGHTSSDLAPQPPQLSFQRIQFGAGMLTISDASTLTRSSLGFDARQQKSR